MVKIGLFKIIKKHFLLIIVGIAIIVVTIVGSIWLLRPHYGVLFSGLKDQEAVAITNKLDDMKVDYRLENNGETILVDRQSIAKTRMKIMASGVSLHGGVGFEIFDRSDFGMTEFSQKINYQRALQGELERTIESLDEIRSARVHLVIPTQALFQSDQKKPKAAVTIELKRDFNLSSQEITGIQRLVAFSVPELDIKEVTILNQSGLILSGDPDADNDMNDRLVKERETEQYLSEKVNGILNRIFTDHSATATVRVTYNYDRTQRTRSLLLPLSDHQGAVMHQSETRTMKKAEPAPVMSGQNVPPDDTVQASHNTDYRYGREVEHVVLGSGTIQHLSVSVIVPQGTAPEVLDHVKSLVSDAVGLNASRGDSVTVQALGTVDEKNNAIVAVQSSEKVNPVNRIFSRGWFEHGYAWPLWIPLVLCMISVILPFYYRRLTKHQRKKVLSDIKSWLES